jgi:hypothetical protein
LQSFKVKERLVTLRLRLLMVCEA